MRDELLRQGRDRTAEGRENARPQSDPRMERPGHEPRPRRLVDDIGLDEADPDPALDERAQDGGGTDFDCDIKVLADRSECVDEPRAERRLWVVANEGIGLEVSRMNDRARGERMPLGRDAHDFGVTEIVASDEG